MLTGGQREISHLAYRSRGMRDSDRFIVKKWSSICERCFQRAFRRVLVKGGSGGVYVSQDVTIRLHVGADDDEWAIVGFHESVTLRV